MLPDGRVGLIDHFKGDGNLGIRPVDSQGNFYPNPSPHWTEEQRQASPEEVAIHASQLKPVPPEKIPLVFLCGAKKLAHPKNRLFK